MPCPSDELLAAFAAGDLEPDERALVEAHLAAGCASCAGDLAAVTRLRRLASDDLAPEPPPWVLARAERIPGEARERGLFARLYRTAELVVDTFRGPLPVGARATAGGTRQLLYHVDDYDVDVRIAPAGDGLAHISGQLLPPSDGAAAESDVRAEVLLSHPTLGVVSRATNALGEFDFGAVEAASYALVVETAEARLLLESIPARFDLE
jgi:anti-sigma factor RsiW